jgi:hypothetical protein
MLFIMLIYTLFIKIKIYFLGLCFRASYYNIYNKQLYDTFFSCFYFSNYMFRAFLAHLQELIYCMGSCWLNK